MMNENTLEKLKEIIISEHILEQEPMSAHTTFRVGGPADVLVTPDRDELSKVLAFVNENDIPHTVLGNGSNVLVSDSGLRGIVICLGEPMSSVKVEGNRITAEAGARLTAVSMAAKEASLEGLEFAAGIPGTLGGAVMMNAGAYGGQISDVIESVKYMTAAGELGEMPADKLELAYRHSVFMNEEYKGAVVVEATFVLTEGDKAEIEARIKDFNGRRRDKQPLEFPSAGSTFKRPEGYFAGKLIQDAGLAGYSVGGACVSEKHCGFVVNKGGATASDIYSVISDVRDKVEADSGIVLQPEVVILGEFS